MSKNKEYAEKYAVFAMEQMRKYGIPAWHRAYWRAATDKAVCP